jgi:hypothetical protein
MNDRQLRAAQRLIEEHQDGIRDAWRNISQVEVTNVSKHGFWLLLDDEELFLPFTEFPWFKDASIGKLLNVGVRGRITCIGLTLMWTSPSSRFATPNSSPSSRKACSFWGGGFSGFIA